MNSHYCDLRQQAFLLNEQGDSIVEGKGLIHEGGSQAAFFCKMSELSSVPVDKVYFFQLNTASAFLVEKLEVCDKCKNQEAHISLMIRSV